MSKALKAAIEANDAEAAKVAIRKIKDLSRRLPKADTPLVHACKKGADAVVAILLEAGVPIKGQDDYKGFHPLTIATEQGHASIVRMLAAHHPSSEVVEHALFVGVLDGQTDAVRALLESCHPVIPHRVLEVAAWWKSGALLKLLTAHGADVNSANDGSNKYQQLGETPLHDAAGSGHLDSVRLLLDHGARVNARDGFGRTPLIHLAAAMPRLELERKREQDFADSVGPEKMKEYLNARAAQSRKRGDRSPADGLACAHLLLERGADASLADNNGNDALVHYERQRRIERAPLSAEFIALIEQSGATGLGVTGDLIMAAWNDNLDDARAALAAGANTNHAGPLPEGWTPLSLARSPAMVKLLLNAGANPNQATSDDTPLISNARSGNLDIVKLLVQAGADINAVTPRHPGSSYVANAYSAAETNRKFEVVDYLKVLGGQKPVSPEWEPLTAGVGMWENFSEIVVKGSVSSVAAGLARLIGAEVIENAYGKCLVPGKRTFVVARPRGMDWCNIMQIAPLPNYYADPDTGFLGALAQETGASVILAQYSDAAGAAESRRFEPDGRSVSDDGADAAMLEEMVAELGNEASPEMKARLKQLKVVPENEQDSSNRLTQLAQKEKFSIAWGGFYCEPGRALDISFESLPAEAFDGVAWVNSKGDTSKSNSSQT